MKIYVSGSAGCGKTTFINKLKEEVFYQDVNIIEQPVSIRRDLFGLHKLKAPSMVQKAEEHSQEDVEVYLQKLIDWQLILLHSHYVNTFETAFSVNNTRNAVYILDRCSLDSLAYFLVDLHILHHEAGIVAERTGTELHPIILELLNINLSQAVKEVMEGLIYTYSQDIERGLEMTRRAVNEFFMSPFRLAKKSQECINTYVNKITYILYENFRIVMDTHAFYFILTRNPHKDLEDDGVRIIEKRLSDMIENTYLDIYKNIDERFVPTIKKMWLENRDKEVRSAIACVDINNRLQWGCNHLSIGL